MLRLAQRAVVLLGWAVATALGMTTVAQAAGFELSPAEQAWIREHPAVKVGFSPSYPPYSFPDQQGRMQGIDLDYLALVTQRTGLRFEPVVLADWPAVEAAFAAGKVDVLTLLVGSPLQRQTMLLTRAYLSVPRVIVSRTSSPYYLRPEDLRGLRIGEVKGYLPREGPMREIVSQGQLHEYESMDGKLEALARGEIDAVVADLVSATYSIRANHLTNLRLGSVISAPRDTFFGVSRENPMLAQIMDRALADITAEERRAIDERWVSIDVAPSKWLLAFKVAMGLGGVVLIVFLALYAHHRRLAGELAERRVIQARLEEAHTRLARISDQKTELLRMVAHDIRGPLTDMLLSLDLAKYVDRGDEKGLRDLLERFRGTTAQLRRLVNDLVDAQATEDGQRRYLREEVDVVALLRDASLSLQDSAACKGIELRVETEEQTMAIISDGAALRQVVDNLVSNALKFTGPETVVTIAARWNGDGLKLSVADQGPGIRAEERERIFTRYGQGAAKPTGGEKSTGLGLWIVRNVVAGLGGDVRCESEVGHGATFIVDLPRRVRSRAAA